MFSLFYLILIFIFKTSLGQDLFLMQLSSKVSYLSRNGATFLFAFKSCNIYAYVYICIYIHIYLYLRNKN